MENNNNYSFYLDQASDLLNSPAENSLNSDEKTKKSIELAELLILHLKKNQLSSEKKKSARFSGLLNLLKNSKNFYSNLIDQVFRSSRSSRIINQASHLLICYGKFANASLLLKIKFFLLLIFGPVFPKLFSSLLQKELMKQCLNMLSITEKTYFQKHFDDNKSRETIFWLIQKPPFGAGSIKKNLKNILSLIQNPKISSLCVDIMSLCSNLLSNIDLLAKEELEKNIKIILQAVLDNPRESNGQEKQKLFFLDFESHKNQNVLIDIFEKVLLLEPFLKIKLGITLKAYFPESFQIQKRLVHFAKTRIEKNGSPIIIRLTKGYSLNLEQIEASKNNWPSPTFTTKIETDANFKKMVEYGCRPDNAKAVNLGIVSCNIFDISYSFFIIKEHKVEHCVFFEIAQERLTASIIFSLKRLIDNVKISCPIIDKKDFHHAIFFILKKINDFSNPDNFIFHLDCLFPGTKNWEEQIDAFKQSIEQMKNISNKQKQCQNRNVINTETLLNYENDPITDFSVQANIDWAHQIIEKAKKYAPEEIPLVINGKRFYENINGIGAFPSKPNECYKYSLADIAQIEKAIVTAKENEKKWFETPLEKRLKILSSASQKLRDKRAFFIQMLILDIAKSLEQADMEISDAIDALNYHRGQMSSLLSNSDLRWKPKGTFLIMPSWGFPVMDCVEPIASALIAGNVVILKPLEECVLTSYHVANLFWEAGVPPECLQFVACAKDPFEKKLISDKRINSAIISTSSKNVKKLVVLRNGLELFACAGGINSIIVSDMSDKEIAIKHIIDSAFKFSGQKFSSAHVLILEKNIYDDYEFKENLKDAANNLATGSSLNLNSIVTPLVKMPSEKLKRALTSLDKGEWWLVKPAQDPDNPRLFSCGIKYGLRPDGFTINQQIAGPVLSVIRAEDFNDAIKIANNSNFGLAAGLHSLDVREHNKWLQTIKAGNLYINTKITDAKIKRQPFGGYKESSFGSGYKSGGPNYILDFVNSAQISLPKEKYPVNDCVNTLTSFLEKLNLPPRQLGIWHASVASYAYWWKRLKQDQDYCKIIGQDNYLRYVPRKNITLRLTEKSFAFDALRVCAAALTCASPLEISWSSNVQLEEFNWIDLIPMLPNFEESKEAFYNRVKEGKIKRIRLTTPSCKELKKIAAHSVCHVIDKPVLANGKFELLHYLKEITITCDYHRYGNLIGRESEMRKPIL